LENYAEMMFQGAVAELQKADGGHAKFQASYRHRTQSELSPDDIAFIHARDSFYIASVNADGWPYIQHRGGPRGFLRVVGPNRLACADYRGNRQFITMGNLMTEARVSLFLMDYLNRARLKIQGRATLLPLAEADPDLAAQLAASDPPAERALVVDVAALDWNCQKYIPTLVPEDVLRHIVGQQIGRLQAENEALRAELAARPPRAD
jgi:predicted pyridoxine 5'-phosphate oxidase superfamily flavin-nucleotide-binding protein